METVIFDLGQYINFEDYKLGNINEIPIGKHVRYYVGDEFKRGGFLVKKVFEDDYVILSSIPTGENLRWKVDLNSSTFFMRQ